MNPPDTLSISNWKGNEPDNRISAELIKMAENEDFNLQINLSKFDFTVFSRKLLKIERLQFDGDLSDEKAHVFRSRTNSAVITLNAHDARPPAWPEDVIFMGHNSAHRLADAYSGPLGENNTKAKEAIWARRSAAWAELGIPDTRRLAIAMGTGNSFEQIDRVPAESKVFSTRHGEEVLRSVPAKKSIAASIEGGNMLSNGAEPGRRKFLVGLDSVSMTQARMNEAGKPASFDEAKTQIEAELHLIDGDRVIFVEQPSYHLDLTMGFCGENEVVLSDSLEYLRMRMHSYWENDGYLDSDIEDYVLDSMDQFSVSMDKIENDIQQNLESAGITVIRKPWVSEDRLTSFFNGEFVRTNDDRKLFITNNFLQKRTKLALSRDQVAEVKSDIREFYAQRGVEVRFISQQSTKNMLPDGGGIGCKANGMRS